MKNQAAGGSVPVVPESGALRVYFRFVFVMVLRVFFTPLTFVVVFTLSLSP